MWRLLFFGVTNRKDHHMHFRKDWIPTIGALPALSIKQPYASAIVRYRVKCVEMRTWATPYRGQLVLHAGKSWINGATRQRITHEQLDGIKEAVARLGIPRGSTLRDYPLGAAIGVARLVDCHRYTSQQEFERDFARHKSNARFGEQPLIGWYFEDVQLFGEPVEMRGYLGLFPCSVSLLPAEMCAAWK
jgi:hypothetical protein